MGHIRDVDPQLVACVCFLHRDRIVDILGVCSVDGKDSFAAEIEPVFELAAYAPLVRDLSCFKDHLGREDRRKPVELQHRKRTDRSFQRASEACRQLAAVFAVPPSSFGYDRHDLVMLTGTKPQRVIEFHGILRERIRHQFQPAELVHYLSSEAGEMLLDYGHHLGFKGSSAAAECPHQHHISRHGSHKQLAGNEVFLAALNVLHKAVGAVQTGDYAALKAVLVDQPQPVLVLVYLSAAFQLFKLGDESLEVKALDASEVPVQLLEGHRLFAGSFQHAQNSLGFKASLLLFLFAKLLRLFVFLGFYVFLFHLCFSLWDSLPFLFDNITP